MPILDGLPILGAALTLNTLAQHRDWILDKQRDLELQDFCELDVLDGDWRSTAEEVKRLLTGYEGRLGIHGPFWSLALDAVDPMVRAVVTRRLLQGLEICEALGATQMVIHSPYTTWDHANLDIYPNARDKKIDLVHDTLATVVPRAEDIGVELVIENIEDIDPYARVELAESFDSDGVLVSIDTGHALYAHMSHGAPPVDFFVQAADDLLAHIHLQDADGYADRHWQPGDGVVNWRAVFAAIAQIDADPRLIIEVRDPRQLMRGVAYLTGLGLAV
ncbi:MAG: sugar phosphate isomerase/epimerase [Ancalomicrobiaceae bacterium]|nr:sugar phosphate isomerase/epimerase [Ancalomicrobiaceae bacterium]